MSTFVNGRELLDVNGNTVHCHGAGFLKDGDYYYMFGENRDGDNRVSCYRSKNLVDWEFRNICLKTTSEFVGHYLRVDGSLKHPHTGRGVNIERPKVIYCKKTKKYVMWMHWENGMDYRDARCAIATCDTIDGDYVYHGSFNPLGYMSRDCTLFVDDDDTAYFISAARENEDMHVYRLTDDYMAIDEMVRILWPGQCREAPSMFKRNGYYFMLTSLCTGWNPNQGAYAYSKTIDGRWSNLIPFGDITTYNTQPTYVVKHGEEYIYVGDRWDPRDYNNSNYVFLPIKFESDTECSIKWASELEINGDNVSEIVHEANEGRLMLRGFNNYLAGDGRNIFVKHLGYKDPQMIWELEKDGDKVRILHAESKKYLQSDAILEDKIDADNQRWEIVNNNEAILFKNCYTGKILITHGSQAILTDLEEGKRFGGYIFVPKY